MNRHTPDVPLHHRPDKVNDTIACFPYGEWLVEVHRADGRIERKVLRNVVTDRGLNRIANRAVQATGTTPFNYIIVGTATQAGSLNSVQSSLGEVIRRASIANPASTSVVGIQSREWIAMTATFGGSVDGLTGIALDSAAIHDYVNSHATTGIVGNHVNGLGVTLQNSDLLNLTVRIRVGSHDIQHTG